MEVKLRKWEIEDLADLVNYANNNKIADNLADAFPSPYTPEDGVKFIQRVSSEQPTKIFAVIYKEQLVGSIGVFPGTDIHRKNAAIAYWIAEPFWGKGIATKAIRLIVKYGFSSFEITRIYAKPFSKNIASQRVLEKAGLKKEAILKKAIFKNGKYIDELIYSLLKI